jgi:gas vesicle protein
MRKADTRFRSGSPSLYFLTGIGAGIALAVVLAPRSGSSTRRLIARKLEEGEDWMKEKAAAAQDYVSSRGERLGDRIKEAAEAVGRNSSTRLREELESSTISRDRPALRSSRKRVVLGSERP